MRVIYCKRCAGYLKTQGYRIFTGAHIDSEEIENGARCEFCNNEDEDIEDIDLIECEEV
jgi:hypothetical protein